MLCCVLAVYVFQAINKKEKNKSDQIIVATDNNLIYFVNTFVYMDKLLIRCSQVPLDQYEFFTSAGFRTIERSQNDLAHLLLSCKRLGGLETLTAVNPLYII